LFLIVSLIVIQKTDLQNSIYLLFNYERAKNGRAKGQKGQRAKGQKGKRAKGPKGKRA